jgi:hypothetical protein
MSTNPEINSYSTRTQSLKIGNVCLLLKVEQILPNRNRIHILLGSENKCSLIIRNRYEDTEKYHCVQMIKPVFDWFVL